MKFYAKRELIRTWVRKEGLRHHIPSPFFIQIHSIYKTYIIFLKFSEFSIYLAEYQYLFHFYII